MINWLSNWAEAIIIAVIIGTIIEMLLPEGNCKKYIKVVIGIYVMFTIVNPIITKISGKEITVSEILELDEYISQAEESIKTQNEIEIENENNIMEMYVSGIKQDIKLNVEEKGYVVTNVDIEIEDNKNYKIKKIIVDAENIMKEENTDEKNEIEKIEMVNDITINISNDIVQNNEQENSNNKNLLSFTQKQELKEYLNQRYEIDKNNIIIN